MTVDNELVLKLIRADHDHEIVEILQNAGYWDNPDVWRDVGDNESNQSVVANQQANPLAALVEKITNSIDAMLMKLCLLAGVDPESEEAPKTMREAVAMFVQGKNPKEIRIDDGLLVNWLDKGIDTRQVAQNIYLVASGHNPKTKSGTLTLSIIDEGEGQCPQDFSTTFMTVTGSNKARVPFLQGQWGQGGLGVLPFCSDPNRFQIVISRRNPEFLDDDGLYSDKNWGYTVVRLKKRSGNEKISKYQYLAPTRTKNGNGNDRSVLESDLDKLPLMPIEKGKESLPFSKEIASGSMVKLIDYDMKGSGVGSSSILQKSGIYEAIGTSLASPALPFQLYESRTHYNPNSRTVTVKGFTARVTNDRLTKRILEDDFPIEWKFIVKGETVTAKVYLFAPASRNAKSFTSNASVKEYMFHPVCYVLNGQLQGKEDGHFFNRAALAGKLAYVKKNLGIHVDMSDVSWDTQEEIFMTSRDRIRANSFTDALQNQLLKLIAEDKILRMHNSERGQLVLTEKVADPEGVNRVLEKLLEDKNSKLSQLLITGGEGAVGPGRGPNEGDDEFQGKKYPTFFKFKNSQDPQNYVREVEVGRTSRIEFVTDAVNDYFTRDMYPGEINTEQDGDSHTWSWTTLHNGSITLTLEPYEEDQIGQEVQFNVHVGDDTLIEQFKCHLTIKIVPSRERPTGPKKPPKKSGPKYRMPPVLRASHKETEEEEVEYIPEWNETSALRYIRDDDNPVIYYNKDNKYLALDILNSRGRIAREVLENRFSLGLSFIALFLANDDAQNAPDKDALIGSVTRAIAPVINPMISDLSALDNLD